jgi:hypothetical protein
MMMRKVQWKANRCVCCAIVWQVLVLVGLSRIYLHMAPNRSHDDDGTSAAGEDGEGMTWLPPVPQNRKSSSPETTKTTAAAAEERGSHQINDSTTTTDASYDPSTTDGAAQSGATVDDEESSTSLSTASVRERCFRFNTDPWLDDKELRASNNDEGFTPELVDTLLEGPTKLGRLPDLLGHTLCHPGGPFRNLVATTTTTTRGSPSSSRQQEGGGEGGGNGNDGGGVVVDPLGSAEDWYHRFFYLTIHWRFHQPALREHRLRRECLEMDARQGTRHVESFMEEHKIGRMDYECRHHNDTQKFLVVPVGSVGFGAFLNTQAVLSVLLALQTGRIPIFSVRAFFPWQTRGGRKTDPWLLAPTKCLRKDMQCYFLPPSPCTVTDQDLREAPVWGSTRTEQNWFAKDNLVMPPQLEESRVVVVNPGLAIKAQGTRRLRKIASSVIQELLAEWKGEQHQRLSTAAEGREESVGGGSSSSTHSWSDEDWRAMEVAHGWLVEKAASDPRGLIRHVYTYLLRPNPHYGALLRGRMADIIPPADGDPSHTVGFAIRGSDKCISESTCLPFSRYMELAADVAYPSLPRLEGGRRPKLIMTTEDGGIFNQSLPYQRNQSFPFAFLVNDQDNMQGSGYPRAFRDDGESTIVSSLTALQMHLSAGRVYLNCCSNFHAVLGLLLEGQCGARRHGHAFVYASGENGTTAASTTGEPTAGGVVPPPVAHCLNDEGLPRRYRICCNWARSSGGCKEIWEEYNSGKAK